MRKIFIIIMLLVSINLFAGEWSKSLNLSVTINQSKSKINQTGAMTDKSNLNFGLLINGDLTKDNKLINWKNTLKFEYAKSKNAEYSNATNSYIDASGNSVNPSWTEDIDELKIDSVYRWKMSKFLNPYLAGNFQTECFDVQGDNWKAFRPMQLRESAGVGTPIIDKENHTLLARLGVFFQHYINKPNSAYESTNGIELVFDYKNQLKKETLITSKLGLYSSMKKTVDPWDVTTESNKIRLEWDNTLITKITKFINIIFSYNVDNIDITNNKAHYEWEQKFNLAFNYKVF